MTAHNEAPARQPLVAQVDADLAAEVRRRAEQDGRTTSGWLRQQLAKMLQQEEKRNG